MRLSPAGNTGEVVIDNIENMGDGDTPTDASDESTKTEGQSARSALAVLRALNVIAGTPPVQGTSSTVTAGTMNPANPAWPGDDLIRALAAEAAIEDESAAVETAILSALNL